LSVDSYVEGTVFVTTTSVSDTARDLAIDIVLNDGTRTFTGHTFEYRNNPVFSNINPRNHLTV